jgi:hypothetical protein
VQIASLKAVANLLIFDDPKYFDVCNYAGLLDILKTLAYEFNWNEDALAEIAFCICNIIASSQFDHHQFVLKH